MTGTSLKLLGFKENTTFIYDKQTNNDTKKQVYYTWNHDPVFLITGYGDNDQKEFTVSFFEKSDIYFTDADHLGRFLTELKKAIK